MVFWLPSPVIARNPEGETGHEYSQNRQSTSGCGLAVYQRHGSVKKMKDANVGAVVVLDKGVLQGMFSERDVMLRIVFEKKDPEKTAVKDVMTTEVVAIAKNTKPDEAVK